MKSPIFWVARTAEITYCSSCMPVNPSKLRDEDNWGEIRRHDLDGPSNPTACSVCGWIHLDDRPTDEQEN